MASRTRGRQRARQHIQPKALHPAMGTLSSQTSSSPVNMTDLLNRLTSQNMFNSLPMARDPRDRVPFGPLNPLNPSALDPARPDTGRPGPRLTEYPVATNIDTNRPLPWQVLHDAANNVDIMRRCIEVRKADMRSLGWAWVVSDDAVAEAYRNNPARGKSDLAADLREQWMPDIKRLTEFWEHPWKSEGLDFGTWINMVMEDRLVYDGVCVYPQTTWGGDLLAFEIIDPRTIKVLRDFRGARPVAPFPAYQQILYGFPRGEFQATVEEDDAGNQVLNGGFLADQMYYHRENARSSTPYGYGPVEQALISARLYLMRQGWMLAEYNDGVLPNMLIEATESLSLTPIERRAYETSLNDELTGQTKARHRAKFMFPGTKTTLLPDVAERYKPDYDLYLIKLLASHFGVSATKLGFSETKGLGGAGMHEAQAQAAQDLGVVPDIGMLTSLVRTLSAKWLKAPPEIEFKFLDADGENEQIRAQIVVGEMNTAQRTVNEARTDAGRPLLNIPEADMPFLMSGTGPVFLEGSSAPKVAPGMPDTAAGANAAADAAQDEPAVDDAPPAPSEAEAPQTKQKKAKKPIVKHAGPDHVSAQAVIDQLSPDYPPESMGWISGAHWSGPTAVPLSKIDFDDVDSWDASTDDAKVDAFATKIRAGKMKPVVLVKTPGDDRLKVVDGHHRVLAYQKLGKPVMAWVGRVGAKVGPWTTMHSAQHTGGETGADAPTTGAPAGAHMGGAVAAQPAAVKAPVAASIDPAVAAEVASKRVELAAYRRFSGKGAARRPFTWVHHTAEEVAAITGGGEAAGDPRPKAVTPGWATSDAAMTKVDEGAVGDVRARHLIEWFNHGADGRIDWGGPGDLTACHAVASEHMTSDEAWGFCNNRHRDVLGTFNDPGKIADADMVKVGPKGYIHGWIFVGPQAAGSRVFHAGYGHGTVTRNAGGKTHVKFDSGKKLSFEHAKPTAGKEHFKPRPPEPSKPSEPSKPAAEPKDKPKLDDVFDEAKGRRGRIAGQSVPELVDHGNKVYGGQFGGLTTTIHAAHPRPDGSVMFSGHIHDADGKKVGEFQRLVGKDKAGKTFALHHSLVVDSDHRGQKFAAEFNANAEKWYRDQGVERIQLHANIDVGGYAWARNGYDFANQGARMKAQIRLDMKIREYEHGTPEQREQVAAARALLDRLRAGESPSAYEFSEVGRPPGASGKDASWIGKDALLGSQWDGVKWLT